MAREDSSDADPPYPAQNRVHKTLRPGRPGTRKASRRHEAQRAYVRHRTDRLGLCRITTVQPVVDHRPLHPRAFDTAHFGVHIPDAEPAWRRAVKQAGGRWDPRDQLWWISGKTIRSLDLIHRIVSL